MEKVREGLQRRARRMQENLQQSVGLSEKKDELQSVSHVEQRNQKMIAVVKNTRQNLQSCIKSVSKEEAIDKRKRRLDEFALWLQLQADAKELENVFPRTEPSVLAAVVKLYGDAIGVILEEKVLTDQSIEKNVIDAFAKYIDEDKALSKAKEKLTRTVLDVEVCRKRRLAYHDESKAQELQDGYDALQLKLDNHKDSVFADIFSLSSKEAEIASVFKDLVIAQMEYHRTALQKLENILPEVDRKIALYPRRPVFGCHLEDHLRYSNRSIALVLEVCCCVLKYHGFNEKGLFRVSGNNNRIRRLKAAFDAHQMSNAYLELGEYLSDPHSVCSVLKSYLRELPEPLMTHSLHSDWLHIAKMEPETRKNAICNFLPLLPEANRLNLAYLIKFLHLMLGYEENTKMGVGNLSIVFGPNLFDGGLDAESDMFGSKLVETLISNANFFFPNDCFTFTSPLVEACLQKTTGSNGERLSLKSTTSYSSTQLPINNILDKQAAKATGSPQPPARVRPKWPAPPPPVGCATVMTTSTGYGSENALEEGSPSVELSCNTSYSASIASNESAVMTDQNCCTNVEILDGHCQSVTGRSSVNGCNRTLSTSPATSQHHCSPSSESVERLCNDAMYPGQCEGSKTKSQDETSLPDTSANQFVTATSTKDNRTLVRLEIDATQGSCSSVSSSCEAHAMSTAKPPLPMKPKPLADAKPNEVTKL